MDDNAKWRPRARSDLVFRRVGDEWLLFDPAARKIHVLNLTAALVWSYCTGEYDADEIAAAIVDEFGTSGAADQVAEILRRYRHAGLLHEG